MTRLEGRPLSISNTSMSRDLLFRVAGFGAARTIPAIASMVFVGIAVRKVGMSAYAYLTLATAIANSASTYCSGWLAQGLLRYLPGRPARARSVTQAMRFSTSVCLLATIIAALVAVVCLEPSEVRVELLPGSLCLAGAMMLQNIQAARLMVAARSLPYLVSEIVRSLLFLGLVVVLVSSDQLTLRWALWVNALSYGVSAALLQVLLTARASLLNQRRTGRSLIARRATCGWVGRLWRFGLPMSIWLGVMVSLPLIDRGILIARSGATEAGAYSAAYDLFYRAPSFLFAPLLMVFHPHIMSEANTGRLAAAHSRIWQTFWTAVILSPAAAAVLACLASPVADLLHIDRTRIPFRLAFLLTLGGTVWQCGMVAHKYLEIQQRTTLLVVCLGGAVATQTILVWVLAPAFGSVGAALAGLGGGVAYAAVVLSVGRPIAAKAVATAVS